MAQQQRYTPVPSMGPGGNSFIGYDDLGDSRYPTPQRLSMPISPPRTSSLNSGRLSNPNYADPYATPDTSDTTMPPMTQVSQPAATFQKGYANPSAHLPIPSENYYPVSNEPTTSFEDVAAQQKARSRKRWFIIGGIILAVAAVVGIVVGVVVSQVNKNDDDNNSNRSSNSTSSSGNGTLTIGSDPSTFEKDSRLHQVFWGFAYTPNDVQLPDCGATQNNITRDIQLLSQLTTRLRLYGANCNQTALVMQAIQDTKVNMTIWPAIYIDSNEEAYKNQLEAIVDALQTYGVDMVEGITVGNEYILNTAGSDSTTSSAYKSALATVADKITEVNSTIQALGLSKNLPIGTSDAGSVMSKSLGESVDFFMANVHPWFGSLAIDDAATWTYEFFQEFDVEVAAEASNNPTMYIAETGWPTNSSDSTESNDGAGSPQGDASVANLQTFLDTFICQANANGTQYFYFEAFDEPWKEIYGGVEPWWGLFDFDRELKNITIPTCN
ncbi:glucan 1,3-beta-glucosidase [Cryptococcus neoformans]|nr:glucan 1,3-beta-glucosidase [Cryptococcus neoformans var. grubii c45]OXB33895.1 glucan 1,3-beta-glucosidase [Cryptococcus neoformans var. grubii]OXC58040.1 glucan 1,3-beta-glucosidase [Cryptococcus neoformans var. grubii MW-RSA852]